MKAQASFHGTTADDARDAADEAFDRFFGEGCWEFVSSDARPLMRGVEAERVVTWEVEFEAEGKA